jgi:FixJ family two-component response regulator
LQPQPNTKPPPRSATPAPLTAPPAIYLLGDEERRRALATWLRGLGPAVFEVRSLGQIGGETRPQATGCAIVVLSREDAAGCELLGRVTAVAPGLACVVVAEAPTVPETVALMRRGAVDVLEWPVAESTFRPAITEALKIAEGRAGRAEAAARIARLSERHLEVLKLLLAGSPNKAVAAQLGVGLRTVERLRSQALDGLGVRTLAEAAELYRDSGAT